MKFSPDNLYDPSRCISCGLCCRVCPSHAAVMIDGHPLFNIERCISCGHCGGFCPENCFGLEPLPQGLDETSPAEYGKLLEWRRSVRHYSPKVPSEEEIIELLSVVSQSPTGQNSQGVTVRAVIGTEAVRLLLEPVRKLLRVFDLVGLSFMIGKLTGRSEYLTELRRGKDVIFLGAPVVLFFHVQRGNITWREDGVIAATTVMHHAVSMGMGTLWNGVAERLYPLIPAWHSPGTSGTRLTAVLCIGYSELEQVWKIPGRDYRVVLEGGSL